MMVAGREPVAGARPWSTWAAITIEVLTALAAIPVGWRLVADPSGSSIGLPAGWIEDTVFQSYLIPGLYLLLVNGVGMLIAAALCWSGHRWAPALTGVLGAGLVIWILVQLVLLPETSALQWVFLAAGLALIAIAAAWLRRPGTTRWA
jgi:hypothetical protein